MRLNDFQKVVAMKTLSSIGGGFAGIFLPIYLLSDGYPLITVIKWLLVQHVSLLAGAFLTVWFANRIGLVRCWYIRVVFVALLCFGFLALPYHSGLLFILAVVAGLGSAFFWIPYNIFIARKTIDANIGSSFAYITNASTAASLVVPGLAALLIVYVGYYVLFIVAFLFIFASILPMLSLRNEKTDFQFTWRATRDIVRANRQFIIPEIVDNLSEDAQVVWVLFVFVAGFTVLDVGMLGIIASVSGMFVTYIVGRLIDHWDKKKLMRIAAVATTLLWIASYVVAVFAPTPAMLYLVTTVRGFVLGVFVSVYSSILFNRARPADAQFLVLREIPVILGRVILFVCAIGLSLLGHFEITFIMVALVSLYFWFNNIDRLLSRKSSG